jgi:hypothetical protein
MGSTAGSPPARPEKSMRYEHLVQINDPLMPLADELTREQLWRGLVLRAEDPTQFVLGLENATIRGRTEGADTIELARTLDFGSFTVDDRVLLIDGERTEIHIAAGATWPASTMTITIEEPAPQLLFLRFVYELQEEASADDIDRVARALREQAYEKSDLDTVVRIRQLAEQGVLG